MIWVRLLLFCRGHSSQSHSPVLLVSNIANNAITLLLIITILLITILYTKEDVTSHRILHSDWENYFALKVHNT